VEQRHCAAPGSLTKSATTRESRRESAETTQRVSMMPKRTIRVLKEEAVLIWKSFGWKEEEG
jgi:hypothetical protein